MIDVTQLHILKQLMAVLGFPKHKQGLSCRLYANVAFLSVLKKYEHEMERIKSQRMDDILKNLPKKAEEKRSEMKRFFTKLKKRPPKNLDYLMQELHENEFEKTDCLQCANCCKTTGPLFTPADIERIAKHFRLKPQQFIEKYIKIDEDNDHVLQQLPCSFLGVDNYCSIYEVRPKACKEFPHTDRKKFHQIANLTLKNVSICIAAFNIVEEMKKKIPH